MARKEYTPEQIIGKLREVEVLVHQGHAIREAARRIGVSDHTYYVWRKEYGSMGVEQARRLKELEKENVRLNPNPPKDTDGRREGSGRGWVRELQGRWPGLLG